MTKIDILLDRVRRLSAAQSANLIARAFRDSQSSKRSKFSADNIGFDPGTETTKRYQSANLNGTLRNSRTLHTFNLCQVPLQATNTGPTINTRERQLINLKGFKFCVEVRNETTAPMYYNWAIISPKDSTATAISSTEFFRGNGISRNQAFDTTLSGQMHCLPINSDKFTILEHKRFRLNTSTGTTYTNEDGSSYMNFQS
jgi:hypothetical protein